MGAMLASNGLFGVWPLGDLLSYIALSTRDLPVAGSPLCSDYCAIKMDTVCEICRHEKVVHLHNSYEDKNGVAIGEGYYPYLYLAEIWKPTTFEVSKASVGANTMFAIEEVQWKIEAELKNMTVLTDSVGRGIYHSTSITFQTLGMTHVFARLHIEANTGAVYYYDATLPVTVKYVRHELRSLSMADRTNFIRALHVMYNVPQEIGVNLYGSKYRSATYMVRKHLYGVPPRNATTGTMMRA